VWTAELVVLRAGVQGVAVWSTTFGSRLTAFGGGGGAVVANISSSNSGGGGGGIGGKWWRWFNNRGTGDYQQQQQMGRVHRHWFGSS
jgi:hypothetical protein